MRYRMISITGTAWLLCIGVAVLMTGTGFAAGPQTVDGCVRDGAAIHPAHSYDGPQAVGWDAGGGRTVDVVGDTSNSSSGTGLAKANAYRVDTEVMLETMEFYLNFTGEMLVQYYVYESTVEFGTYAQIWTFSETVNGTGMDWYSSGTVDVLLEAGNYYIIAVSWDGNCGYFYDTGDTQSTSFGAQVHGYAMGNHPLPTSFSSTVNDHAIYYQRLTTGTGFPTPTPTQTFVPCNHDGDVTLDDEVTAGDAQLAFLITLGIYIPNYEEECAADCNGDTEVTAGDAQQIFLMALGLDACVDPMK